jgi:Domain of unknown function (DUF4037)
MSFVPGRELARTFYVEVVAPLLVGVRHSAAFIGWGSDVLGFDDLRSTDHGWGPRLQVFVAPDDVRRVASLVEGGLPEEFRGYPTRFGWDDVPVSHHVEIVELGAWLTTRLGFDPRSGISSADWLVTPQQRLLELTAGPVFHDGLGEVEAVREVLSWYPHDVWLWLLACQWRRIDQEEAFVGRTAEVGDELGSRLIAARLVRDMMRLCFLLERRYTPYSKWFGSAFHDLDAAAALGPPLAAALAASDYPAREEALVTAAAALARRHNALGVTEHVDETVGRFHSRPYRVLGSARFVGACLDRVSDPGLRALPLVGSVDQLGDSTDLLEAAFRRLVAVY